MGDSKLKAASWFRKPRMWMLLPFCLWLVLLMLYPLSQIVVMSFSTRGPLGEVLPQFTLSNFTQLANALYLSVFVRTLLFSLSNTAACVLLGFPIALLLSQSRSSLRPWLLAFVLVPFCTSCLIRIFSFMDFLRLEPLGWNGLYTVSGSIGAMVYNYLPFAILPMYSALEKIEASTLEAAKDLGAGKRQVLWNVILPLAKPGIFSAAIFVFVPSLGEFLIPELVGGGRSFVLGNFLQNQFLSARNWPLGSAAIVVLCCTTIFLIWLSFRSGVSFGGTSTAAKNHRGIKL